MPRHGRVAQQAAAASHETQIDTAMGGEVDEGLKFGMDQIIKFAGEFIPMCDDDIMLEDVTQQLRELFINLVRAKMRYDKTSEIVDTVFEDIDSKLDLSSTPGSAVLKNCDVVGQRSKAKMEEYMNTITDDDLMNHACFHNFEKAIQDANDKRRPDTFLVPPEEQDTEVETEEEEGVDVDAEATQVIPTMDPLTRRPIRTPVRNKRCKHIYDKESMIDMIKKRRATRCPIAGCANAAYITENDLEQDRELTKKVRALQRKGNKKGKDQTKALVEDVS